MFDFLERDSMTEGVKENTKTIHDSSTFNTDTQERFLSAGEKSVMNTLLADWRYNSYYLLHTPGELNDSLRVEIRQCSDLYFYLFQQRMC